MIVGVSGEVDKTTGFVIDIKILRKLIASKIEEKFDHKNLNIEVEYFKNLNPTAENISIVIWNILRAHIDQKLDLSITLYETPRNYVVYNGD